MRVGTKRICGVDGCGQPFKARDRCKYHYYVWVRDGGVTGYPPAPERFDAKVNKYHHDVSVVGLGPCWLWTGALCRAGYGMFREFSKVPMNGAHIYAYKRWRGPIPPGYHVDHLCRTRNCVNPDHLEAVPMRVNMDRAREKLTHCKNGHEYTEANTKHNSKGYRICAACERSRCRMRGNHSPSLQVTMYSASQVQPI